MERLLPKDDYFKHTTRKLFSDREKQQVVDAVDRAARYLNRQMSINPFESMPGLQGLETRMMNLRSRFEYLSRSVSLIKGSTQPRHLYRRSRRRALEFEALTIARETGADFLEVRDLFLTLMNQYVSDYP